MKVAIIPARGGSKRIPRKNIKNFLGKPMIAWSIETAIASKLFDRIIVSTDDLEISKVAKKYEAEVPFLRPAELSNDYVGTTEVIAHATQWLIDQGLSITAVCCIYPTAPFLQVQDLSKGLQALESGNWSYAFSATDFTAPIFRAFTETDEGGIKMFFPEYFLTRSQDLPRALHDAGQFYWGQPSAWLEGKRIFEHYSIPIIIPRWRVQDIDSEEDWIRAEIIAPMVKSK
ncbi:pseudaminic acid cytidylyltransferase [Prochlorothrix hollandica]|uniref:NeuA n=1 Tax=Prochlorothrix hollandica PCC 9006 = CALU 1027 TaxID=317619 RepID=A0A0M2PWR4_PROHO|nr:pseudaminic acid cytidylyltransferase [Prochlorothrix hollandica]KKI99123.1 NeuA [Prochlorothrix hollandica PCC 9006 = CALU 1027]